MTRGKDDALRWLRIGTDLVLARTSTLTDTEVAAGSPLPGWSIGQLVGHLAANGAALTNLATWAATGIETPMYASVEARDADIAAARDKGADELVRALVRTADALTRSLAALDEVHWATEVRTIQGRTLPATEIPWLRAREVCVHAVDLGSSFADLPVDFLDALVEDICTTRGLGPADIPEGPLPEAAAWLAGRPHGLTDAPEIGAWL